jgi:hypothetical protein
MPANTNGSANFAAGPIVYPASVKGVWVQAHNNLSAGATSAANLVNPVNGSDTNAVWVRVPDNCTRVAVRGKCAVGISGVTQNPIVYIIGIKTSGDVTTTTVPSDATATRLDGTAPVNPDNTGQTLSFAAASGTTRYRDGTSLYSYETAYYDCQGAAYVLVLVQTAANLANAGTVTADVCFLN